VRALLAGRGLCAARAACHATPLDSLQFCGRASPLTARQQDRLLRVAAILKDELEASGASVALVARSGLDLQRFRVRYSHAGVSLKSSANAHWSVRAAVLRLRRAQAAPLRPGPGRLSLRHR
jgi:hypothetical protein